MSDECIHGFTDGLCASCFPKIVPEPVKPVRQAPASRGTAAPRRPARGPRTAAHGSSVGSPSRSVLDQRLYHVTHISNLPEILATGGLAAGSIPVVDIAVPELRIERSQTPAPGQPGRMLDEFVPFFLSPDARLWQALRDGVGHPRLGVRAAAPDFVFLVSTMRQLVGSGADVILADGDILAPLTRFAATAEDTERMLERLRTDQGATPFLDAELLVHGQVSIDAITLVGVANDKVRSAVRDVFASKDYEPKISVYPPWFQRPA